MSNRGLGLKRFWSGIDTSEPASCWIWTKNKTSQGYGTLRVNVKWRLAHRMAWELTNGPIPLGLQIDHSCHNRLCVNPSHLRLCTPGQNNMNHFTMSCSSSGVKGVRRNGKRWMANIQCQGVRHYLGTFDTKEEAHAAYCAKGKEIHGEFFNKGTK